MKQYLISSLPYIIKSPGYYVIEKNFFYKEEISGAIIVYNTSDVIIDGRNNIIFMKSNEASSIICENFSDLKIKNLSIVYAEKSYNNYKSCFFINGDGLDLSFLNLINCNLINFDNVKNLFVDNVEISSKLCRINFIFCKYVKIIKWILENCYIDCRNNSIIQCYSLIQEAKKIKLPIVWFREDEEKTVFEILNKNYLRTRDI